MKSFKGRDRVPLSESSINPRVSRLVNEVNSLLTTNDLLPKLTRLPSDLPSVMKVKEEINDFLMNGELNSLLSEENSILLDSERLKSAYADYQAWNNLLLEAEGSLTEIAGKKGLLTLKSVKQWLYSLRKVDPTLEKGGSSLQIKRDLG